MTSASSVGLHQDTTLTKKRLAEKVYILWWLILDVNEIPWGELEALMNVRIHPFEGYSGNILRHSRFEWVLQNAVSTSIQKSFKKRTASECAWSSAPDSRCLICVSDGKSTCPPSPLSRKGLIAPKQAATRSRRSHGILLSIGNSLKEKWLLAINSLIIVSFVTGVLLRHFLPVAFVSHSNLLLPSLLTPLFSFLLCAFHQLILTDTFFASIFG